MNEMTAMSIGIGVLGGLATFLTATILPLPVWVIFIAWASFFAAGGKVAGLRKSVTSNLTGGRYCESQSVGCHGLRG